MRTCQQAYLDLKWIVFQSAQTYTGIKQQRCKYFNMFTEVLLVMLTLIAFYLVTCLALNLSLMDSSG